MKKTADISNCGLYRYSLSRIWEEGCRLVLFVGLNPSTADAETDDNTIRRCVGFAKLWGFGGLLMANLFAFRATDPKDLLLCDDPVGPGNDDQLLTLASQASMKIACWGVRGGLFYRDRRVADLLRPMYALGFNRDGSPKHPLYLPADTKPTKWGCVAASPRRGFCAY